MGKFLKPENCVQLLCHNLFDYTDYLQFCQQKYVVSMKLYTILIILSILYSTSRCLLWMVAENRFVWLIRRFV